MASHGVPVLTSTSEKKVKITVKYEWSGPLAWSFHAAGPLTPKFCSSVRLGAASLLAPSIEAVKVQIWPPCLCDASAPAIAMTTTTQVGRMYRCLSPCPRGLVFIHANNKRHASLPTVKPRSPRDAGDKYMRRPLLRQCLSGNPGSLPPKQEYWRSSPKTA